MKKFMVMAVSALMALTANAQNPDGVKQILASKSYKDAKALLSSSAASMTSEERAKALNKLVDLASAEYDKAEKKAIEAQLAKNEDEIASQTAKKVEAAYNAIQAARECNIADNEPNAKGQVKPKFKSKNASRLLVLRNSLIDAGLNAYNTKDYATAKKFFGAYVEVRKDPLFDATDFSTEQNYGQMCYYAGLAAYFDKDWTKCSDYADFALSTGEKEVEADVITLKLGALEGKLQAAETDSTSYLTEVKKFYEKCPENEVVFGKLVSLLDEMGDKAGSEEVLKARLAQNPTDAIALAYLGQNAQNDGKYAEAIEYYGKALQGKPDFIQAKMNLGVCYLNKAAADIDANTDARGNVKADKKDGIVSDLNNAKAIFEEIKGVDPDQEQVKWAYPLERVNYALDNVK